MSVSLPTSPVSTESAALAADLDQELLNQIARTRALCASVLSNLGTTSSPEPEVIKKSKPALPGVAPKATPSPAETLLADLAPETLALTAPKPKFPRFIESIPVSSSSSAAMKVVKAVAALAISSGVAGGTYLTTGSTTLAVAAGSTTLALLGGGYLYASQTSPKTVEKTVEKKPLFETDVSDVPKSAALKLLLDETDEFSPSIEIPDTNPLKNELT